MLNIDTYLFNPYGNTDKLNHDFLMAQKKLAENTDSYKLDIIKSLASPVELKDINDIIENQDKFFIEFSDKEKMLFFNDSLISDYVEGAVRILFNNQTIIGLREYDVLHQLWLSLVAMVHEFYYNDGIGYGFWPGQPIELMLTESSNSHFLLTYEIRGERMDEWKLPKSSFIDVITEAGTFFFNYLYPYKPEISKDGIQTIKEFNRKHAEMKTF